MFPPIPLILGIFSGMQFSFCHRFFSVSIKAIVQFLSYVIYFIHSLIDIKQFLHFYDDANLIVVDVLLDVCL